MMKKGGKKTFLMTVFYKGVKNKAPPKTSNDPAKTLYWFLLR